jgi:hypothetical protein
MQYFNNVVLQAQELESLRAELNQIRHLASLVQETSSIRKVRILRNKPQ